MQHRPVTLVSGTAADSFGSAWVTTFSKHFADDPIIAIDRAPDPNLTYLSNVFAIEFDLNPLTCEDGYDGFAARLERAIETARVATSCAGVATIILAAGVYDAGSLVDMPLEARKRLLGVNVCGKVELLHAVLDLNQRIAIDNSAALTLIEIGSIHGLAASSGRAAYAATKAFGLDLALALWQGKEVKRAICVAPGPIDTHMLHRNHWVTKEGGSVEFFDFVRIAKPELYRDVFMRCDSDAFEAAVLASEMQRPDLAHVFARYAARRAAQQACPAGVLCPQEFANYVADVVVDESSHPDGVYVVTAPGGQIRVEWKPFEDVIRR